MCDIAVHIRFNDVILLACERCLYQVEGWTALHVAAYEGRLAIAQKLIDSGAVVDARTVNM
jgi:hypothetical protein